MFGQDLEKEVFEAEDGTETGLHDLLPSQNHDKDY
jgi:hypothetical protein